MLSKVESNENKVLDCRNLSIGSTVKVLAKLVSLHFGTVSETGAPYVLMTLQDVNGVNITGSLFSINQHEASLKLKPIKGSIVEIIALVGIYKDKYSLRFNALEHINSSMDLSVIDLFTKRIEGIDQYLEEVSLIVNELGIDYSIPYSYKVRSLSRIYNGKIGGVSKLLNDLIRVSTCFYNLPGIDSKLFMQVLLYTFNMAIEVLIMEEDYGFIDSMRIHDTIHSFRADPSFDERSKGVIMDSMESIAKGVKGEHPYSAMVIGLLMELIKAQEVASNIPSMVLGNATKVGDSRLSLF